MTDSNNLQSFFLSCEPCTSTSLSSTDLSMFQGAASNLTSTNAIWPINPFDHTASNFVQQETPKEVKTELKKAIQGRKIANGEEMPEIEWKEPSPPQPRPPEKPEDIQIRRQKNKIAAKKCREKKKFVREEYRKKIEKQEEIHSNLSEEVQRLRQECRELKHLLQNHDCTLHTGALQGMNSFPSLEQFAQQAQQADFNAPNLLQFNLNCSLPLQ